MKILDRWFGHQYKSNFNNIVTFLILVIQGTRWYQDIFFIWPFYASNFQILCPKCCLFPTIIRFNFMHKFYWKNSSDP